MNNLPANMGRHTAFRDNEYKHTFIFPETYALPTVDQIKMQIRANQVVLPIEGTVSVLAERIVVTYPPSVLQLVPAGASHYLVLSGRSVLGGPLYVLVGYGAQDITETQVAINENDEFTTVEISGMTLISALISRIENLETTVVQLNDRITFLENIQI
jgi:hypothetical protein